MNELTKTPNYHPKLHLLAVERIGWRRWVFGRWVYNSEPFRRDIQRKMKGTKIMLELWEQTYPQKKMK